MGLIFYMSAENASQSTKTSSSVIEKFAKLFISSYEEKSVEDKKILISSLQHFVRKMAHFLIYAALGFSCTGFASTFEVSAVKKLTYCQIFCSFYAVTDEIHQKFSPGRSCEIKDMLLDSVGSFFGIITVLLFLIIIKKLSLRGKLK
jgi:VanZ family protein